jgi:hypothetical protein
LVWPVKLAAEDEEMMSANHRERQFMQHLRGAGWVKAIALPDSPKLIASLLNKGWIESSHSGSGVTYRITHAGLAAKSTPVKL